MSGQGRKEVRPLVFGDASDYSPIGRVAVALHRYAALGKELSPLEAIRTSNMLVHPEDITRVLQASAGGHRGSTVRGASLEKELCPGDVLPDMKPSSFAVTPDADIDTFLSSAIANTSPQPSDSEEDALSGSDEEGEVMGSPFGATPSAQPSMQSTVASSVGLRTATAAADQALYTNYHVVIVLDMSQSAFGVARNGDVLVDRMPSIVDLLVGIIRETIAERTAKYNAAKKRAGQGTAAMRDSASALLNRVWCPKVSVSLLMGNAPHRRGVSQSRVLKARPRRLGCTTTGGGGAPLSSVNFGMHEAWGHATAVEGQVPFIPHNAAKPFEPWAWHMHGNGGMPFEDHGGQKGSAMYADIVPVFIGRPAEEIIADTTLNHRIYTFLRQQEIFIRAMASGLAPRGESSGGDHKRRRRHGQGGASRGGFDEGSGFSGGVHQSEYCELPPTIEWEASNIAGLIETIVSMLPADSNTSHTVAIISNFATTGASEDIALLRPAIMTRGVTLGLFSLTAVVEWNWSHLAPVGCLLATTGGFAIPYAKVDVHRQDPNNAHWLRRIDGTDCLARSMFLRKVTDYPGVAAYSEGARNTFLPMAIPNGEMQTAVVQRTRMMCTSTLPITGFAAARVAEGWSAQIEVDPDSQQPRRCRARHNCFLHRGELTFYYEAEAETLAESDSEGRGVRIKASLIAYASSHVIADMAFILKASEDMRLAIEKKGGRRLTISALLRQFLAFMRADSECLYVCEAPSMAQRTAGLSNGRPSIWDDRLIAAIGVHSRPQGCSLPWLYRHNVRQVPLIMQVPDLHQGLMSGSLLTHSDRMARMGTGEGSSDGFDTAAAWRRSRSGKTIAFAPSNRRQANSSHHPPAVTAARLAAFILGAFAPQGGGSSDVTMVRATSRQQTLIANACLTYVAIGRDMTGVSGLGSLIPACGLVQFFLAPAMNECGQEIGALEGGGASNGMNRAFATAREGYGGLFTPSTALGSDASARSSYMLANCVEVRFTFLFVSIRNQSPFIRRILQILDEHAARLATGSPTMDIRCISMGPSDALALHILTAPFQCSQMSLLLPDSDGTSSATNSHIRQGPPKRMGVPSAPQPHLLPNSADDGSYIANFDRISSLASGHLYWSTLIPSQHHSHMYRNSMAALVRRRLALGFEVVQLTACGTWAALFNRASNVMDLLQVHEHPNNKGYDCILGVTRHWHRFDECTRPGNKWQSSIDFQRDHYILSTFHTFTTVLHHATNRDVSSSGGARGVSATSGNDPCEFFSNPMSIASKDFVRNGGHTAAMYCLSGLLVGLHCDAAQSVAPIDCISIGVSCPTSLSLGLEVMSRMHHVVRNMAARRYLSHAVPLRDLPQSIQRSMAPAGMCAAATVTIAPCDDSSFLAIIVPIISNPSDIQQSSSQLGFTDRLPPAQGDVLRLYVAQISIDSVLRGMNAFSKSEVLPRTYYDTHYGIARPMLPNVPRASAQLITICATLEVYCVASRAWLLQRACINMPPDMAIPKALCDQLFSSFKALSLYTQDVDASFINEAWNLSHPNESIGTGPRLASAIAMFLKQQTSLRPLQGDEGDDEMARTTFLVTRPTSSSFIFHGQGGPHHRSDGGGYASGYHDISDGHVSSTSGGHRTDGEGGMRVSAPAEIEATFVPMVFRFLVYSKDTDGHGTSAWVGSRDSTVGCRGCGDEEGCTASPVSLFLRIYIVSLPHDVFNITSHGFKPPPDILRRFAQGISEDLTTADEPIPPSWNYFSPQPFTCDDLLLPFNAMPQQRVGPRALNGSFPSATSPTLSTGLSDPMLLRFVRLFPCRGVGESNQLPSPSCTDIVDDIAAQFLAQAADAALAMAHRALLCPVPSDPSASNGDCPQLGMITIDGARHFFPSIVTKALLAPDQHYRVASVPIDVDVIGPDMAVGGKNTEQLMEEVIRRDGLALAPLGGMTYGYVKELGDAEGLGHGYQAMVWVLVCINTFDSTMNLYRHVTTVPPCGVSAIGAPPADDLFKCSMERLASVEVQRLETLIIEALQHIYLSQYLFKLRATRWAHEEDSVIPRWWGVQYADAVPSKPRNQSPPPWDNPSPVKPKPTVRGREVLSLAVHPQFQPKRLLNQMHFSTHFDMLKIVDRRGCFIVPDDVTDHIWHFIRIVLIPEGVASDPDEYPPQLPERPSPGDRFRLVVHIYNSTTNFCVDGTIQAVRECYNGIAVKELMQYMGTASRREALTADDMALLAKERVQDGLSTVQLGIDERHATLALTKLKGTLASQRFFSTRRWGATNSPRNGSADDEASGGAAVSSHFIYHNTEDALDSIVVSAEVTVDVSQGVVRFQLFSSWIPRYAEERRRLDRCSAICKAAIANAQREMEYVSLIDRPALHPLPTAPRVCDTLLGLAKSLEGSSADIKFMSLGTRPRLTAALFSQYVESFCGVLSELSPSLIVHDPLSSSSAPIEVWADFAWHRHESVQQRLGADGLCFYIMCGLKVGQQQGDRQGAQKRGLPTCASSATLGATPTSPPMSHHRAVSPPGLMSPTSVSTAAPSPTQSSVASPSSTLAEGCGSSLHRIPPIRVVAVNEMSKKYIGTNSTLPAVVVKVTTRGTSITCHSIPDADLLFDALSDVNSSYSKRLGMMSGVLTQMLGIQLSPFVAPVATKEFTQGKLATRCCGDMSHVHDTSPIDVSMGCARRHMSLGRIPPSVLVSNSPSGVVVSKDAAKSSVGDVNTGGKAGVLGLLRRHLDVPSLPSVASLASLANAAKDSHTAFTQQHAVGLERSESASQLMQLFVTVIYAGLTNRGVMVDYCLPMDAAVKVLHDDAGSAVDTFYSQYGGDHVQGLPNDASPSPAPLLSRYARCEVIVKALVSSGLLIESKEQNNAGLFKEIGMKNHHAFAAPIEERLRVLEVARPTSRMPVDPFVPQHYHRHLAVAHIITERRFMVGRLSEGIASLQPLWSRKMEPTVALPIVHGLVRLMAISRYYYGSRVPEYSLRREATSITPEIAAKYCNPQQVVQSTPAGEHFAGAVRQNLMRVVDHLNHQFESMYIVAVNPSDVPLGVAEGSDAMLIERFSNRCGLVATGAKEAAIFTTDLIYCAVPIKTAIAELLHLRCDGTPLRGERGSSEGADEGGAEDEDDSDISGGLFIMEVGFNYVNYAIDMYVAPSSVGCVDTIPADLVAEAACAIRSRIQFSSAVYDFMVRRLFDLIENRTAVLPGHQQLSESLANIARYNPTPPRYSYHVLAAEDVTSLLASPRGGIGFSRPAAGERDEDVIRFVVPGRDVAPMQYRVDTRSASCEGGESLVEVPAGEGCYDRLVAFKHVGLLSWETVKGERRATLYTLLVHPDDDAAVTGDVDQHTSVIRRQALQDAKDHLIGLIQSNDQQVLVDRLWQQVKKGIPLNNAGSITAIPRKVFVEGAGGEGGFTRCPALSFGIPPLPQRFLSSTACGAQTNTSLADLIMGLDGEDVVSWEDMATLEGFVTRVVDSSSQYLIEELRRAAAEVGPHAPLAWRARVPHRGPSSSPLPSSAASPLGGDGTAGTIVVTLSLAEAICAYLRASLPSRHYLAEHGVAVHVCGTQRSFLDDEGAPTRRVAFIRIVFAPSAALSGPPPSVSGRFHQHHATAAVDANYLVVVELTCPYFAASSVPSSTSASSPSVEDLSSTFECLAGHDITGISLWREGYGAYGESSAELSEGERQFLSTIHGYLTAVMWAGFL